MLRASQPCPSPTGYQALLNLLGKCKSIAELKQLHAFLLSLGLLQDRDFTTKLVCISAVTHWGDINYSYRIFSQLSNPTLVTWNTIIRGFSNSKNPNRSLSIFVQMLHAGVSPDYMTYPFLAKASARLLELHNGVAVHNHIVKTGHESDKFIQNSLIHMYASCGDIIYARKVFDAMLNRNLVSWNSIMDGYSKCRDLVSAREMFEMMPKRDVVSWSSMIDGYVKAGEYREAMAVFEQMRVGGTKANEVTMVSVFCACAHLGALEQGRMMHHYIEENGLPMTLVLRTSLVDMYAKCGAIEDALCLFNGASKCQTDVLIWNAIIGGLATHGLINESLELFEEMQIFGIRPDEITYLCLLSACAHGGLVNQAWYFFEQINKRGLTPTSEHYACVVDVLSRAGQIAKAYQFLCQIPLEPTASMLGALLNGCIKHRKLDLAEIVGRKLVELDPDHDGRYIGLSNVYASVKRWDDAKRMRRAMEEKGVKKFAGFSVLEISGVLHRFIAHDKMHPDSEQSYMILHLTLNQMKFDVDQENQEDPLLSMEGV